MKTELILVGKTVSKEFQKLIADYSERVTHYMPFSITIIPELKNTKSLTEEQQKTAEGEQILRLLQPSDTVVLLDEHGREPRSIELAQWLEKKQSIARRLVVFRLLSMPVPTSNCRFRDSPSLIRWYAQSSLSSFIVLVQSLRVSPIIMSES